MPRDGTAGAGSSDDVLAGMADRLSCPHCGGPLAVLHGSLLCTREHRFDIARQGYVSLLRGDEHTGTADTAAMVAARERFVAGGHLSGLRDAIVDRAVAGMPTGAGCVVEVGAGTGYHLAGTLDRMKGAIGLALDISKPALRRAARAHPRMAAVACDVWGPLPLADGAADLVLDVFAPRNAPELHRILRPGGVLVVATPTPDHLHELVEALGLVTVDTRKEERLSGALGSHLIRDAESADDRRHVERLLLDHASVADVAGMGPSARHLDRGALDGRIGDLPSPVEVTVSVSISVWRRPPDRIDVVRQGPDRGG
jgi:23S rRNA (guanine745-N1)-methyltransferase